jgi:hypothetical protein
MFGRDGTYLYDILIHVQNKCAKALLNFIQVHGLESYQVWLYLA